MLRSSGACAGAGAGLWYAASVNGFRLPLILSSNLALFALSRSPGAQSVFVCRPLGAPSAPSLANMLKATTADNARWFTLATMRLNWKALCVWTLKATLLRRGQSER